MMRGGVASVSMRKCDELQKRCRKAPTLLPNIRDLMEGEIKLATRLYVIARGDSQVGSEPSMQCFCLPHDIRERIVSCRHMPQK